VLYLFLVGIEMDPEMMLKNARKTIFVALSGVGLPFALGFAMSPYLFKVRWTHNPSQYIYMVLNVYSIE
jgi:Kef-type K+ transport system membrane component KefB